MMDFSEFADTPFFTALEIFIVVFCGQLIELVVSWSNNAGGGPNAKKTDGIFHRAKFWLKHVSRFNRAGIDMRRSWSRKRAEEPFKAEQAIPRNVFLTTLPMLSGMGRMLLINFALAGRPAARLPFDIPWVARGLFQYGMPQTAEFDPRLVSAFGFSFLVNICAPLMAAIFPAVAKKRRIYRPDANFQNFSDLLVTEKHEWELEKAEDELLALIDEKMSK